MNNCNFLNVVIFVRSGHCDCPSEAQLLSCIDTISVVWQRGQ